MKYYVLLSVVLTCILIFLFSCEHEKHYELTGPDGELCASEAVWSHEEGDLQNTKRATGARFRDCITGPTSAPQVKWSFQLGGSGTGAAPVIADDGTIYIVGEYPGEPAGGGIRNSGLLAISPSGSLKWFFSVPLDAGNGYGVFYNQSVALGKDGTIYFAAWDSNQSLFALNPDGTVKWKRSHLITQGPVIDANGNIYAGSDTITCLNPEGHVIWKFQTDSLGRSVRMILGKHHIFCLFPFKGILALSYSGNEMWFYSANLSDFLHPGIIADEDDNIYFKINSNNIVSVSSSGQNRWGGSVNVVGGMSEPALRGDYLYFVSFFDLIRLDKASGTHDTILASFQRYFADVTSPLIDDNGTIYVASRYTPGNSPHAAAVSKDGTLLWELNFSSGTRSSSWGLLGLSRDGILYVATYAEYGNDSFDSYLSAFK
jgi:outer membrane protein assembly factor BamB